MRFFCARMKRTSIRTQHTILLYLLLSPAAIIGKSYSLGLKPGSFSKGNKPKKANGENKGPIRLSRHVTRIVHTKEGNTGVLMWGHPGSAIGTLHASLLRTISQSRVVEECNQRRTGFDEGISRASFLDCADRAKKRRALLMTHIQPQFLSIGNNNSISTAHRLMLVAEEAGIQVMVAVHRRNQLAQMVSAFKIQNKADHIRPGSEEWNSRANQTFGHDLVSKLNQNTDDYKTGIKEAQKLKFSVLEFNFKDVAYKLCSVVDAIIKKLKARRSLEPSIENKCERVVVNHKSGIHGTNKELSLLAGMPVTMNTSHFQEVYEEVVDQLSFTNFEWMLRLEQMKPMKPVEVQDDPPTILDGTYEHRKRMMVQIPPPPFDVAFADVEGT